MNDDRQQKKRIDDERKKKCFKVVTLFRHCDRKLFFLFIFTGKKRKEQQLNSFCLVRVFGNFEDGKHSNGFHFCARRFSFTVESEDAEKKSHRN